MKTPLILLVDDEAAIINSLSGSLDDEGYIVLTASDGIRAVEIIKSQPVDVVFLDIWLPEMDGLATLNAIKDFDSNIEVVIMTGHGTVNTAVKAVKQGAFDFLEKPFSFDTVIDIIKKIAEKHQASSRGISRDEDLKASDKPVLTGKSPSILKIKDQISFSASCEDNVFIRGEIGTGKELVARLIHDESKRKSQPLTKCNCAVYNPEDLVTELLGSQKSKEKSYRQEGVIRNATEGTIFLDSIDLLPLKGQKRLANFLASAKQKGPNARIIVASVKDIDAAIDKEAFHKSLLDCFPHKISMPSLRNRRGDIPILLSFFVEYFCKDYGFRIKSIEDDALETLVNYDWPGNVKELKNLVEKLVVSVPTKNISIHDIPLSVREDIQYSMVPYYERYKNMEEAEAAWRKKYVLYYLRKNNRDIKRTAAQLNIKEKALLKYIKEYGIMLSTEKKDEKNYQRTLKRSMVLSGRGLHSGDKTGIIITPLPTNSGIVFGNISSGQTVPANIDFVRSTDYATCLENSEAVARTIEHILAALHAFGITNLMIKINNEVPIMDGSAVDFCQIIEDAGIEDQDELAEEIVITEKLLIGEAKKKNKFIMIEPADKFSISYVLDYPKPVGRQEYTFVPDTEEVFKKEIAPARTFGFLKDIEALEKKGLGGGGRLNNFILIDDEKIVNTALRFPDEFVRHKILDLMGDLYLLGRTIKGKVTANMTGHSENAALVRLIRDKMQL